MEIFIRKRKSQILIKVFALFAFLTLPFFVVAQTEPSSTINSRLSGTVVDAKTGEPLPGAVVNIKGVTNSTVTDVNGKFTLLTGQKFPYTIVISYTGFKKQDVVA